MARITTDSHAFCQVTKSGFPLRPSYLFSGFLGASNPPVSIRRMRMPNLRAAFPSAFRDGSSPSLPLATKPLPDVPVDVGRWR